MGSLINFNCLESLTALDICHKHFLRLNRLYVVAKWYKNTVCGIRIPYGKYPVTANTA